MKSIKVYIFHKPGAVCNDEYMARVNNIKVGDNYPDLIKVSTSRGEIEDYAASFECEMRPDGSKTSSYYKFIKERTLQID